MSIIFLISLFLTQLSGVILLVMYPGLHLQLKSDRIALLVQPEHNESLEVQEKQSHLQKMPSIKIFFIAHCFAVPFRTILNSKISKFCSKNVLVILLILNFTWYS